MTVAAASMGAMSDVLTRSVPPTGEPPRADGPAITERPRPAALGGALAAAWSGVGGVVACSAIAVIGWLATAGGSAPAAIRVGAYAWLLAHAVPIELPGGGFGLAPLGLTIGVLALVFRAGLWAGRTSAVGRLRDLAYATGAMAGCYGGFAALVAVLARAGATGANPLQAFVMGVAVAGVGGGAGLTLGVAPGRRVLRRVPEEVRTVLRGAGAGLAALVVGAFGIVVVSLVAHAGRVGALWSSLAPGALGTVLLAVVCLAYLPNAVVFAAAYALGPGFALGVGTVVSTGEVRLGPLPAFPLLAAVPAPGTPEGWSMVVLVAPFAAGVVAGMAVVRRNPLLGPETAALYGGLAGGFAGLGFAVLAALAGGAAGPGRLASAGPTPLVVGVVAVLTLAVAGALAAVAVPLWGIWQVRRQQGRGSSDDLGTGIDDWGSALGSGRNLGSGIDGSGRNLGSGIDGSGRNLGSGIDDSGSNI